MKTIQSMPINRNGDLLFIKDFEQKEGKLFLSYRAMINDIPFRREQVFEHEGMILITGDDGTVMYRFPLQLALKTQNNEDLFV
ncbi:MAG: hypothetical protein ACYC5G_04075 [Candidatus Doudnabacteria bacterium]